MYSVFSRNISIHTHFDHVRYVCTILANPTDEYRFVNKYRTIRCVSASPFLPPELSTSSYNLVIQQQ